MKAQGHNQSAELLLGFSLPKTSSDQAIIQLFFRAPLISLPMVLRLPRQQRQQLQQQP